MSSKLGEFFGASVPRYRRSILIVGSLILFAKIARVPLHSIEILGVAIPEEAAPAVELAVGVVLGYFLVIFTIHTFSDYYGTVREEWEELELHGGRKLRRKRRREPDIPVRALMGIVDRQPNRREGVPRVFFVARVVSDFWVPYVVGIGGLVALVFW